jgi:pyruvate,water dikinase
MGEMLARLEKAYGHPLDTEFTAAIADDGSVRINLLQCRPMRVPSLSDPVVVPAQIPRGRILFRSGRTINGGVIPGIRYVLYIDPKRYADIDSEEIKKSTGRLVGQINNHPGIAEGKIMMMGPGRWGSSNIDLGVNVSYADISNTSVLVEIAREEAGHVPEVSYGTHFFLDLVEARIVYLPVYPNDPLSDFNDEVFARLPNILGDLLPGRDKFLDLVRLFDLPVATGGRYAKVVADPQSQKAICFLE